MKHLRLALVFSVLERYLSVLLAFGSSLVLARLLTPEEIGVYSVTVAVIGIAHVLRDFGVGSFLIQETELPVAMIRSAFGVSLVIGVVLFGLLVAAAPHISRFYEQAQLSELMQLVALNFLVLPFCTVSLSLLRREMKFRALMWVNLCAAVCATTVTVYGAWAGWGPACMAVGAVTGNLVTAVASWVARGCPQPMGPSLQNWRPVARFGTQTVSAGIVTSVAMDINDLVVGKVLGMAPVAISSRAQGLMNLFHRDFMAAIRGVMFPAFAQAHREGGDVDARHTAAVVRITALAWPFYGFVALNALEILRLLFGPQWDAAAPLVPIFCLAGAVVCVSGFVLSLLTAVGRNDLSTIAELWFQPCRAAVIVGAAVTFQSLQACAWAFCLSFCLQPLLLYRLKERCVRTEWGALLAGLLNSLAVTALTLLPSILLHSITTSELRITPTQSLLVFAAASAIAWLIAILSLKHPLVADLPLARFLVRTTNTHRVT